MTKHEMPTKEQWAEAQRRAIGAVKLVLAVRSKRHEVQA